MTDKEIIKALECCITSTCISNKCPYEHIHDITMCTAELTKDALALINRQHVEIERLKSTHPIYNFKVYQDVFKQAKAEAIKECLEWVLSLFPEDKNFTTISRFTINQRLNGMVGEDNV